MLAVKKCALALIDVASVSLCPGPPPPLLLLRLPLLWF